MEEKEKTSDYDFIREQIRERPINRRKLFRRTLLTAGLAVLFGVVACVTFLLLEPVISRWISSDEDMELTVVSLPAPVEEEETRPQVEISEDEGEKIYAQALEQEGEESAAELPVVEVETPIEDMTLLDDDVVSGNTVPQPVEEEPGVQLAPSVVYERAELELEDYRQLYRGMYEMSREVSKSLVTITAITTDEEWLSGEELSLHQEVGLIVAENGYELLILADSRRLEGAERIGVSFFDGTGGELRLKSVDQATGLAVYAIRLNLLPAGTRESAVGATATLGSSYTSSILGNAVIAVGRPLGSASVCYGAVTSTSQTHSVSDASYQLLTTDIYAGRNGSGILVNLRGQVVGVICQGSVADGQGELLSAYGISSIRKLVENLTNEVERPRLGVYFSEVPAEVSEELGIPQGVCVTQVEMDSPAMNAGLAKGDIVQQIGGAQCSTAAEYMNAMQSHQPGETVEVVYARTSGNGYRTMRVEVVLDEK